ncbi:MAG TPA: hypothetical protein VFW28_00980 [Micropepsaceae bacterium]|nr:hypothetical protein [Micropepsaceae bacterium]
MAFTGILKACKLAIAASIVVPGVAMAQTHPEFIALGRVSAALYKPDSGPAPHIAFLVSHRTGNNLNNPACKQLAARGFLALCWNTRFVNNEASVHWEDIAFDVKTTVDYVRSIPGITRVILLGHSGGSPLMSYYEAVAEAGPNWCKGPDKLVQCTGNMDFKPADGVVFPDAHPGNGVQSLRGLNPSVSVVDGVYKVDPSLDPFSPANGFNPEGASDYSKDFQNRYFAAQSKVMNDLIAKAQAKMTLIREGKSTWPDDDIFIIPGGGWSGAGPGSADLNSMDPNIAELMSTARPEKLLKNDGTTVTQVVHSVSVPEPENAKDNRSFDRGTKVFTLKSFLSANAVKSTNALNGIDWCSSNNSTMCAVQSIKIPTLIAAMGAYHFIRDQELMYDLSAAKDKDYIVIEGAVHGYTPCKACEKTPGQYSNSEKNLFDYIQKWANARF